MKIKNWIEMLIGLAIVRNNGKEISMNYVRSFGEINGLDKSEIDALIKQHVEWCREEGLTVLME